jgi:flagellum-specific ATP synthase
MNAAARYVKALRAAPLHVRCGRLLACDGFVVEANGPESSLGELCEISGADQQRNVRAQIVGLRNGRVVLMPYGPLNGIQAGARVYALGKQLVQPAGDGLLGRVIDAFGEPIDACGPLSNVTPVPLHGNPINPLQRRPIETIVETGVTAIDAFATIGQGQRIGIFAGSGVGKSTLMGMLAKQADVDVIVVALIGERGREVGDFITTALGDAGLARSVVIAATSDQPPLARVHATHAAHAVAEFFRDRGQHVLLILDSMTRYAMAQREIGIAAGEPPTSRGYPPSVFTQLPRILERCGSLKNGGSITAAYSVLVEGDDMNEPVADHMRAILDGHIVLARELADRGQLPAVDVLRSISRLMGRLISRDEAETVREARALLATHERSRDLISMGAYKPGHDERLDLAVQGVPMLERLLRQTPGDCSTRRTSMAQLEKIVHGERDDT